MINWVMTLPLLYLFVSLATRPGLPLALWAKDYLDKFKDDIDKLTLFDEIYQCIYNILWNYSTLSIRSSFIYVVLGFVLLFTKPHERFSLLEIGLCSGIYLCTIVLTDAFFFHDARKSYYAKLREYAADNPHREMLNIIPKEYWLTRQIINRELRKYPAPNPDPNSQP